MCRAACRHVYEAYSKLLLRVTAPYCFSFGFTAVTGESTSSAGAGSRT